jgi:hypothetical protein
MRTPQMSPALIAQLRNRAMAAPYREVGIPLHLEAPRYDAFHLPAFVEYEADEGVEAGGFTIGGDDEDDDFY